MALMVCPHCGTQVSDKAKQCPNCGKNQHKKPRRKWTKKDYIILFSIIGAVVAICIALFLLLRPDPYLKKGRDYISNDFVQKYKEYIQSKVDRYIDLSDFDISDFISEEWDRESCIKHFNIPLKDDSVYSICAYSFYREAKNDAVLIDDGVPTMACLITTLLKVDTLFVVFRYDEPIFVNDRDGLSQRMESNICVVKKDGSTIHLDAHDGLELDYLDSQCMVNGHPDFEKFGKEMAVYIKQRYGEYEVLCGCNSVDDVKQQITKNTGLDMITGEHDLSVDLYGCIGGDNSAWLKIENGQGSYHFLNYTRNVQVKEYNPSTKKLIVHGYAAESGDYIGEFDGSYDGATYQGTFTNYKGVKITFRLSKE